MFSAQSLLAGNGTSVTIPKLTVATYVTPLVVRNFWLCLFCQQCLFLYWFSSHNIYSPFSVLKQTIPENYLKKIVFSYSFLSKTKYFVYFITKNGLVTYLKIKSDEPINKSEREWSLNHFITNTFIDFL